MWTTFLSAIFRNAILAMAGVLLLFQINCTEKTAGNNSENSLNSNIPDVTNTAKNSTTPRDNVKESPIPKDNGYFVLYYGDGEDEDHLKTRFERIRETRPGFVVVGWFGKQADGPVDMKQAKQVLCVLRGGSAEDCIRNPAAAIGNNGIKTLYYVTADQNDSNALAQIKSVMDIDYDGIFFDETEHPSDDVQNNRYKSFADSVHEYDKKSPNKKTMVIVNPGVSDVSVCRMFEYADIVSVENQWNQPVPACGGIAKWRWLSVQGDASECNPKCSLPSNSIPTECRDACPPKNTGLTDAVQRLKTFRDNGGLWYYTAGWKDNKPDHGRLPDFLEQFAIEAKKPPTENK